MEKPKNVSLGVNLLWLSLPLMVAETVFDFAVFVIGGSAKPWFKKGS